MRGGFPGCTATGVDPTLTMAPIPDCCPTPQAGEKGLPLNVRATQVAQMVGLPLEVRGDAFVARFFDDDDGFDRLDFTMSDLSSSAPWVAAAREFNTQKHLRGDSTEKAYERLVASSGDGGGTRAATNKPAGTPAEEAKDRGNGAFKRGAWEEAEGHYAEAVALDPSLVAAHNNRAMVLIKLGRAGDALRSCDEVLKRDGGNVKALLRKGSSLRQVGDPRGAREVLERVVVLQPNNADALAELALL